MPVSSLSAPVSSDVADALPPPGPRLLTERLQQLAAECGHRRAFTFVEFRHADSPGRHHTLTWAGMHARAARISAALTERVRPGERVALLMPQGLDYVAGFLGCLAAGLIAVPLFPPDLPGQGRRITAVFEDCEPACALVAASGAASVREFADAAGRSDLSILAADEHRDASAAPDGRNAGVEEAAAAFARPAPDPEDIAYLQYTSGSTRSPAGVMITHRNILSNALQAYAAAVDGGRAGATSVGWLPLFHDMGLVLSVAAPVAVGIPAVLMDPAAFLRRPARWLEQLARYPGAFSAAPNFAYDYCAARVDPREAAGLRLDRVRSLLNGSEPVRVATLDRFRRAFAATGLRPEALCPSYGLAEATVFVSADSPDGRLHEVACRSEDLAEGRIVAVERPENADDRAAHGSADEAITLLAACGSPFGQEVRIIDPITGAARADGEVGEIAVRGPNVGMGYWKRFEQTVETFGTVLDGAGRGTWLRTGDLGALHEGRLLVTGRLKDLLIVDGRNHYPQDVEETLHSALDCVRRDRAAVFAPASGGGSGGQAAGERIIAVAEYRRALVPDRVLRIEAERQARAAVAKAHGLRLDAFLLVPPGSVPRTSSGKISRTACRAAFESGQYERYRAETEAVRRQDAEPVDASPRTAVRR